MDRRHKAVTGGPYNAVQLTADRAGAFVIHRVPGLEAHEVEYLYHRAYAFAADTADLVPEAGT